MNVDFTNDIIKLKRQEVVYRPFRQSCENSVYVYEERENEIVKVVVLEAVPIVLDSVGVSPSSNIQLLAIVPLSVNGTKLPTFCPKPFPSYLVIKN